MAAPATPEQLGVRPVRRAFEQVADQLCELIVDGTLRVGQRLPTEAELSVQFESAGRRFEKRCDCSRPRIWPSAGVTAPPGAAASSGTGRDQRRLS